jgi:methionine synthase I (cobalamin-dependent)
MLYYKLTGTWIDSIGKNQEMCIIEKCQEELIDTRPEEVKEVISLHAKQLNNDILPTISYSFQLIALTEFNRYVIEDNFEYVEIPISEDNPL